MELRALLVYLNTSLVQKVTFSLAVALTAPYKICSNVEKVTFRI